MSRNIAVNMPLPGAIPFPLQIAAYIVVVLVATIAMTTANVLLLGRGRRVLQERMLPLFSRMLLRIAGVRFQERETHHLFEAIRSSPVIVIANHRSTLDVPLVCALGLPNTRFFLSVWLKRLIPVHIISSQLGTFWTPEQTDSPGRERCFKHATRVLKATGDNVFLTPEGIRTGLKGIGAFNRGAFHLAIALGRPIVPMFIETPDDVSPDLGYRPGRGKVNVSYGPAIDTSGWRLETLPEHIAAVRGIYTARLNEPHVSHPTTH